MEKLRAWKLKSLLCICIFAEKCLSNFVSFEMERHQIDLFSREIYRTTAGLKLLEDTEASKEETLINYKNVQYYGFIYVGSNSEKHSVIFDTGSNILWLPSIDCDTCRNTSAKYDYANSLSFTNKNQEKNITYAIGFVDGKMAQDSVGINDQLVVPQLNFLLVNVEKDLGSTVADGVLGIGINAEGDSKNSFIYSLYLNKLISAPKFTVLIDHSKKGSRIYFGDVTGSAQLSDQKLDFSQNYCNIPGHIPYWACLMNSIKISGSSKAISPTSPLAVFDTGTSYLIVPSADFIELGNELSRSSGNKCAITKYNQLICTCGSSSEFPDLEFTFNTGSFKIKTKDLITYIPGLDYECFFEVLTTNSKDLDIWILGDSILRSLAVEFDMDSRRISFQSINASDSTGINNSPLAALFWLMIVYLILVFAVLIITGAMIYSIFFKAPEIIAAESNAPLLNNNNE